MKTLHLVRHAKSSWDDPALADHDRSLSPRGGRDLALMSAWFAHRHAAVGRLVSSPACRALATAQAFAAALGQGKGAVVVDGRLVDAPSATILDVVAALDGSVDVLVVVGHNPGMSDLAHQLADRISHLPTCAVASFVFDAMSWANLLSARCTRVDVETPRTIKASSA